MLMGDDVKVILVCRMGSSRLPGKTLLPFGKGTLLSHIVNRIESGGFDRKDICITTSNNTEDRPVIREAKSLGCKYYAGHATLVSRRILDAAKGNERFILVLGDNPWIAPEELRKVVTISESGVLYDYVVTATPELPKNKWPDFAYPTGTRIQLIKTAMLMHRLKETSNPEDEEHTSLLFSRSMNVLKVKVVEPSSGWNVSDIEDLNISINIKDDYDVAVEILNNVGPDAPTSEVVNAYKKHKEG